jgi:hypothetical protein
LQKQFLSILKTKTYFLKVCRFPDERETIFAKARFFLFFGCFAWIFILAKLSKFLGPRIRHLDKVKQLNHFVTHNTLSFSKLQTFVDTEWCLVVISIYGKCYQIGPVWQSSKKLITEVVYMRWRSAFWCMLSVFLCFKRIPFIALT